MGKPKNSGKNRIENSPGSFNYSPYILTGFVILVWIIYSKGFSNEILHFDDNEYFERYPEIIALSWKNVIKYFSHYYVLMYQPLPVLSFAINYKLHHFSPQGFHLTNLIFHSVNILLVYTLIKDLSREKTAGLIAAGLFAIHPMNVESVAWISAASSSMYGCFFLTSIILYLKFLRLKNRKANYLAAILFFVLSLFSKVHAITLPVILILIDIYLSRKITRTAILEKIPFFTLSVIFGIIAISNTGTEGNIAYNTGKFTFFDDVFLLSYSLSFYFFKALIPINLSSIYVYPEKTGGVLPIEYYLSIVVLLAIFGLIYLGARRKRYIWFGVIFFLVGISVTLQVIPSRLFIAADRYAYIPYVGLFYLAGEYLSERLKANKIKGYVYAFPAIICIFFFMQSYTRIEAWKNDETLTSDIIEKNPEVPYLSRAYGIRADFKYSRNHDYLGAISDYNKALQINPNDEITYGKLGVMKSDNGDFTGALLALNKAIDISPSVVLYNYRGMAKFNLSDYVGAINDYDSAIKLDQNFYIGYGNRGSAEGMLGKFDNALKDFSKAIAINPSYKEGFRNRGILFLKKNDKSKACVDLTKAFELGDDVSGGLLKQNCGIIPGYSSTK